MSGINSTKRTVNNLLSSLGPDIAIDLGTANSLVYVRGKGIVIQEPSVVAVNEKTGQVLAIGQEAKRMVGKTPGHIVATRPLVKGVISDFEVTEQMLKYFIAKAHQKRFLLSPGPRVIIGIPYGVTEVEKKAVKDAAMNAGAREVFLIEEPMAAAIGSSIKNTALAPAFLAASSTARFSTSVTPAGIPITHRGLGKKLIVSS